MRRGRRPRAELLWAACRAMALHGPTLAFACTTWIASPAAAAGEDGHGSILGSADPARFGRRGHVRFFSKHGLPHIELVSRMGDRAEVSLHGGQVTSFVPRRQLPLVFVSTRAVAEAGEPLRGGIPICWPIFGADPRGRLRLHGFARRSMFDVLETGLLDDGRARVKLSLQSDVQARKRWYPHLDLTTTITLGSQLDVALTTTNTSQRECSITEALHAYAQVGDIRSVGIEGLQGISFSDKLNSNRIREATSKGPLSIHKATDRIYLSAPDRVVVCDDSMARRIALTKRGGADWVVWNPWAGSGLADLGREDHLNMVCVEAANAMGGVIIPPGESRTLGLTLGLVE